MKLLFDFLPIFLFFVAFKLYGIFVATAVIIIASVLQIGAFWLKNRRFETMHIITLICVLLFGGATLISHNDLFIKWKPTVIYWLFSVVFFGSHFIGKKPLIQRMLDEKISLATQAWKRLNWSWIIFFAALGGINLYVAYNFSTNAWVNFKLFGAMGLIFVFAILQAIYMSKQANINKNNS